MTPQAQFSQAPRAGDAALPSRPAASGGSDARWAGGIVLALVLYVLSIGPALRLTQAGYMSQTAYELIYLPIVGVLYSSEMADKYLGSVLTWYLVEIWGCKN